VKHSEIRARLSDYLERDLAPEERASVDRHLAACGECREELHELRATVALLRGLPEPALPPGLSDAVLLRVANGEPREARVVSWLRRASEPRWIAPLAAGLAGLLLLVEARDAGSPGGPAEVAVRSDAAPSYSVVLGGSAEAGTRPGFAAAPPRAGLRMNVAPAPQFARAVVPAAAGWRVGHEAAEIDVAHRATRRAQVQELVQLLRGAGHPHSVSLASHFETRSSVVLADWQPR
jgi:anti-sigma factor RsiW